MALTISTILTDYSLHNLFLVIILFTSSIFFFIVNFEMVITRKNINNIPNNDAI